MVERLTAAEAVTAIIALINASPRTPWPDEIAAIVARLGSSPVSMALPAHVVTYRAKAQEYFIHSRDVIGPLQFGAPSHDSEYTRNTELGHASDVAGDVVLNTTPTTWGDIIGLASMVAHEEGHDLDSLGPRRTIEGDPGPKAAEMLALAVLRLHASAVPQLVPVDFELVGLISAWREQRDIIDGTCVAGEGCGRSYEESKQAQAIVTKAMSAACDLAKQIWERAKAETWSGGPVNPLTLAALAEIAFHNEFGATTALEGDGDGRVDEKSFAELMVGVLAFARSAGVASDLLPMEGRFLPPALLTTCPCGTRSAP
jgi:hypothetical protein